MRKLILLLSCAFIFTATAQTQTGHWVATWGTATSLALDPSLDWVRPPPADQLPANPPPSPIPPVPTELENQTVRMIVRSSIAGERLRLQFSNAQGLAPVQFGAVHIALHGERSAIETSSDRVVTFGGLSTVTVHPGSLVVSDPVDLPVTALTELAVSVYTPQATDARATHALGLNTTYIAPGNAVDTAELPEAQTNRTYFWLTGIEVAAAEEAATIIAFGDSITDGYSTTVDQHREWPALLAERLQSDGSTAHLGVINMGISGNRVLRTVAGVSALARFDRDVLARGNVSWIILLEGINDITFSALPGAPAEQRATAEEIIGGLSQLVERAHAHGIKVMGATLTPMGGLWLFNAETEAMRRQVNDWIRNSGKFDALVDFDAAIRDPERVAYLRGAYDSGDHIHPNDEGNVAMVEAIDLTVFTRR